MFDFDHGLFIIPGVYKHLLMYFNYTTDNQSFRSPLSLNKEPLFVRNIINYHTSEPISTYRISVNNLYRFLSLLRRLVITPPPSFLPLPVLQRSLFEVRWSTDGDNGVSWE